MKKEIAKQWVEALRSGNYEQATGVLRTSDNKYCCLGVLCDILHVPVSPDIHESGGTACYAFGAGLDCDTLPAEAVTLSGIGSVSGIVRFYDTEDDDEYFTTQELTDMNDGGKTFVQIADIIEANAESL